jgi:hypothetical protein
MTIDELQDHIKRGTRRPVDRIKCADGFSISVQASSTHHCTPRNDIGPYTHVEIGFPSEVEPELLPYREGPDEIVYVQVPIHSALALINKHGGLAPVTPV